MILRCGGLFYKILKVRSLGDNSYAFECIDIDSKKNEIFQYRLYGFLEAVDRAFAIMKSPKDIFLLDLDQNGEWKIITEDQIHKL
jgi:hypothetical protein